MRQCLINNFQHTQANVRYICQETHSLKLILPKIEAAYALQHFFRVIFGSIELPILRFHVKI